MSEEETRRFWDTYDQIDALDRAGLVPFVIACTLNRMKDIWIPDGETKWTGAYVRFYLSLQGVA